MTQPNQPEEKLPSRVVSALMRLQRAGDANSAANRKLRDAAFEVANNIVYSCNAPAGELVIVPRFYKIMGDDFVSRYSDYPLNDVDMPASVDDLHQFAADIADGLLDEIAGFLEACNKQTEADIQTLEGAESKPKSEAMELLQRFYNSHQSREDSLSFRGCHCSLCRQYRVMNGETK